MTTNASNVVLFHGVTRHNLPPDRVLNAAVEAGLEKVLVLGWAKDGEPYFASSVADGGDAMWLMELCKARLLKFAAEQTATDS